MFSIIKNQIYFIGEQDGEVERDFKSAIKNILINKRIRAYLVQIKYNEKDNNTNVALCYKSEEGEDSKVLQKSIEIFKSMFGMGVPLDIIFINDSQEKAIREVCCPFFTAIDYQVQNPDFYLISSEGYGLSNPIACFKRERLHGKHPDGYLLCDINPFLPGQDYEINTKNIKQLILANRHQDYSLFPIKEWPVYVHVAIPLFDLSKDINSVDKTNLKLIAWGELYKQKSDALSSFNKISANKSNQK